MARPLVARSLLTAVLFAGTLVTRSASAQYEIETGHSYGEVETPRTMAVAGAIHATANSTSALFTNPANMAIAQIYHLGALGELYPEAGRQTVGAAVVDSLLSSTGLAGGLSYTWTQQDPGTLGRQWSDLRFGLALPVPDVLYIGLTGRYLQLAQTGLGPLGYSKASGGGTGLLMETITIDAGVTLRPVPQLVIAAVGHNLTSPDTSLVPLLAVGSVGFLSSEFSADLDVVVDTTTFQTPRVRIQGGAEVLVANRVALRAGYRYDDGLGAHAVAGGVGYIDPKFSIDLGVRRSIAGADSTAVVLGFTVHMETLGLGAVPPE